MADSSEIYNRIARLASRFRLGNNDTRVAPATRMQPGDILFIGMWFALFTGIGEVFILSVSKFFLHRYVHQSIYIIWMSPLADLVIFAIPGLVLFWLARSRPRLVSLRTVIFVFAFLGFMSLLLMVSYIDWHASLLLAAGLALQVARFLDAHPRGLFSVMRITTGWIAFLKPLFRRRDRSIITPLVVSSSASQQFSRREFLQSTGVCLSGMALGVQGWEWLRERDAVSKLPNPPNGNPNVILIVLDTVRAQSLRLYGYDRHNTPQLERLSRRGVRFDRAIATSPWSLPSHSSLFTGRQAHELSANWTVPLDSHYPTLAQVLSAHGYLTSAFVANTYYCSTESGLGRGFNHYEDFTQSLGQIVMSSSLGRTIATNDQVRDMIGYYEELGRKVAPRVNSDFLDWLSKQDGQRPFFAFLNYFDSHAPFLPPGNFATLFGPPKHRGNPLLVPGRTWSPSEIQAEIDAYDGTIAYVDDQIGRLVDELEKRSLLETTLIVITSDHGEEFAEHRVFGHGHSLYLTSLHVPLLVMYPPRVPAGRAISDPVSLRDVPATILNLIGLDVETGLSGSSLARYWSNPSSISSTSQPLLSQVDFAPNGLPRWYPINKGDMKSLLLGRYHYVRNGDGSEELYDFENDPFEANDLASSEPGKRLISDFRASLQDLLAKR